MRKDVFDNLNAFCDKKEMMDKLSPEQKRFVEKVVNKYEFDINEIK